MKPTAKQVNEIIQDMDYWEIEKIKDKYHTFAELYEHRYALYSRLVNTGAHKAVKSKKHHDGSEYDWYFIVFLYLPEWQVSYHIPQEYWDNFKCEEKDLWDKRDWHTSYDVIRRLLWP